MKKLLQLIPLLGFTLICVAQDLEIKDDGSAVIAMLPELSKLSDEVVDAMKKVHSGFKGESGMVAQFGDSITHSMAFWSPMSWDNPDKYLTVEDELPKTPKNIRWRDTIKGARNKGPTFANYSGWKVGNLLNSIDEVIARDKPEVAIIMVGTNDISGGALPENYRTGLEQVIVKCIAANCVPILNTIPPRRDREDAVLKLNGVIRIVARDYKIPLVDYYKVITGIRPEKTWDGTLISNDGVHPSGGKSNDYSFENLKTSGYALRNWMNFLTYRQVYFRILE